MQALVVLLAVSVCGLASVRAAMAVHRPDDLVALLVALGLPLASEAIDVLTADEGPISSG